MFFSNILVQSLLLGAATAAVIPGMIEKGKHFEKEHAIMERDDIADENIWSIPTATIPTTKVSRSNVAEAPSPTQSGLISTCDAYYHVEKGDYCVGIVSKFGNFTLSQFNEWNPAVKSDCSNLIAGYYVCIGVAAPAPPSPTQTGITSKCNDYYKVASGDTCIAISDSNNIALSDFYDWNPAVGKDCHALIAGYYVCVGVSGEQETSTEKSNAGGPLLKRVDSSPTTTSVSTVTATATVVAAPSPTQTGTVSGCTQYYQAQQGDTCITIVNEHFPSLTVAQFESWNPSVGPSCNGLLAGYYYCVAV